MGVRGLTTYINHNEDQFLEEFLLHSTSLVIDGHSLCAQLYRALSCFSAFGGDYHRYATAVKKFFQNLKKCSITCYVLLDGSHEKRKLKTAYSRLRSKLSGASKLCPGNQMTMKIFPLLLRDVFKEVLVDMNIPYTVCEFEADDEIAALARQLSCPVLSYDSDFFIYNVLYIPFPTLNTKPISWEDKGKKVYALECKIYRVEKFLNHFGGLKEDMLPLLATLLGNDYVQKKVFRNFFSHLKLPKSKKNKNEQQRSIQALLGWLRNESLESAVVKIIGRVKSAQKKRIFEVIKKTCNGYHQNNCDSLKYFNLVADNSESMPPLSVPVEILENNDESSSDAEHETSSEDSSSEVSIGLDDKETNLTDSELPEWVINGIRHGAIPQQYINLYTHKLYLCIPQAEDYERDDSFWPCLKLLRYAFDMLNNFTGGTLVYVGRVGSHYRRIYIREEFDLKPPFASNSNPIEDQPERMPEYFDHFINEHLPGLDYDTIDVLPANFKLVMVAALWWVKYCGAPISYVYSLFLCYIMLDVVDEKTGSFRGDYYFKNKYGKKLEEIKKQPRSPVCFDENQLLLNKNKVIYEDCLVAASVMLKMFDMTNDMQKRPKLYDIKKVHVFAQFQCCLQQINYLNKLCNCKYDATKFHKTFNGLLAYNILDKLYEREDPLSFLEQFLNGADTVIVFFKSLCYVFNKNVESSGLTLTVRTVKGKRRGGRRRKGKEISFLCEEFASEVII